MFRTISMQQLEQLLDGERTFTLLDVREQKEYEAGHLLGAVNLPYEQLDEVEAEITKDRPVSSTAPTEGRVCSRRENSRDAGMMR